MEWQGLETLFTRDKGYSRSYGSYFEASASGRWVAQVWQGVQIVKGEPPEERYAGPVKGTRVIEPMCAVIWEVGADGRLVRPVWSSEDKDFVVVNMEWVRDELLLSVAPGIRHYEDFGAEDIPLLQVLAVQPETGQVRRFTNVAASTISAYPSGDRVLLGRLDWYDERGEQWFGVYTYPGGQEIASFRFKHPLEDFGNYFDNDLKTIQSTYTTLLGWADAEHIWALGKRKGPKIYPALPPADVSVLLCIDLTGKVRIVSGDPKRSWVQWANVVLAGETGGLSYYAMRPQILEDGRLAVMMGREPRLVL
ncbi:MAG: hypothetical protein NZT92_15890, partial [Abditibacteriales bacterium]|nr:hypothetical protein [Abditibacteriales bacterium]